MAKKNAIATIGGFDLTLMAEANVTKEDIVAIATTAREELLLSEQTALTIKINKLRQKINELDSKINSDKSKFVESKTKSKAKELIKALDNLGFKVSVDTCEEKRDGTSIKYKFYLYGNSNYHRDSIKTKKAYSISLPKKILDQERKVSAMNVEEMETQEKIFEVKKGLSNMQGMERKARAALAVAALQSSKSGREILKQMQGVVALPQPPREK